MDGFEVSVLIYLLSPSAVAKESINQTEKTKRQNQLEQHNSRAGLAPFEKAD